MPDAVHLPELDLARLQEMAEAGAKVLNAQAVEWARRAKIAIHARRTSDPLDANGAPPRETVAWEGEDDACRVRAVVGFDCLALVRTPPALVRDFVAAATEHHVPLLDLVADGAFACAAIPLLNVPDWEARKAKLTEPFGGEVRVEEGLAMVSVVGDGLSTSSDALARFIEVVAPRTEGGKLPARVVAGPLRLSALVSADAVADAQRRLHAEFVH